MNTRRALSTAKNGTKVEVAFRGSVTEAMEYARRKYPTEYLVLTGHQTSPSGTCRIQLEIKPKTKIA